MIRKTPTKIRRLKNADRVERFFFMYFEGQEMAEWLRLKIEVDLFYGTRLQMSKVRTSVLVDNPESEFVNTFFAEITKTPRKLILSHILASLVPTNARNLSSTVRRLLRRPDYSMKHGEVEVA